MTLDYYESPLKRRFKAVLTKPHQPYFLLGATIALLSIAIIGLALKGLVILDIRAYHAFNMALLMPTALFLGFLFTVLYRFLLVMPFLQKDYMKVFWALLLGVLFSEIGFFVSDAVLFVGILFVLYAQASAMLIFVQAYKKSTVEGKAEIFWILSAFAFGACASLLFALSIFYPTLASIAINTAFYPFAVGVVFLIAQKMVPNFFILYFGVIRPDKTAIGLSGVILCSLAVIAVSKSFDLPLILLGANLIGAGAAALVFWENRFIFRKAPPVLWVLQLGSFWFFAGFAAGLMEAGTSSLLQIHTWGVGFIATMMIGFGSRVAMGHSGRKIEADKITTLIFISLAVLTIARLLGVFFAPFVDISIYLWCVVFGIWIYKYAPMLTSD